MAISAASRAPPSCVPTAPGKITKTNEVNRIVSELNQDFPDLQLQTRPKHETPNSRAKNLPNLCYDRINECYFRMPKQLGPCLTLFRQRAKQKPKSYHALLLECLPLASSPVVPDHTTTPLSPFSKRSRRTQPQRYIPDPQEPEYLNNMLELPSQNAKKRTRALEDSTRDRRFRTTDEKASLLSGASFMSTQETVVRSFVSTVSEFDGATNIYPNISFTTNLTGPDSEPLPNISGSKKNELSLFSSAPSSSLFGQIDQHLVAQKPLTEQRTKSVSGILRSDLSSHTRGGKLSGSSESIFISSNSETRENFIQKPDVGKSPASKPTPSHALSQLHIRVSSCTSTAEPSVTSNPMRPVDVQSRPIPQRFDPLQSHQVRNLPNDDLFVQDYKGQPADYELLWEAQRYSLAAELPIEHFLAPAVQSAGYDEFIDSMTKALPEKANKPPVSSRRCWKPHENGCVQYRANASFAKTLRSNTLFKLELLPLILDQSCRFQEKYGPSRILYVQFPDLNKMPQGPDGFTGKEALPARFVDYLCTPKHFLSRVWRAIHLEQTKEKDKTKDRFGGHRVVFIAVSGRDIPIISIYDVISWHIDIESEENLNQPFRKIFSRLDLGFSKTTPTLTFKPNQVIFTKDIRANGTEEPTEFNDETLDWTSVLQFDKKDTPVMTDGVARMSVGAFKWIWRYIGGEGPLPAAFQGRINGAKGMWVRSGSADSIDEEDLDTWIEIRESQAKLDPHSSDIEGDFDRHRWTFEVLKVVMSKSQESMRSSLHMDMIPLLCDRGVHIEDIKSVIREALVKEKETLQEILLDPVKTRYWLHDHGKIIEEQKRTDIDWRASKDLPLEHNEKAIYMLEHGFVPSECPYLSEQLTRFAERYFSQALKKLNVIIEQSTNMKGVADEFGVLEPGTVHIAFSKSFYDKITEESVHHLHARQAIVTRHPMQMPSDIQKVRIVYNEKLAHLKDCVVFPTKGQFFICSKCQGGDLDGDTYSVIWDQRLVTDFKNAPVPRARTPYQYFGITQDRRTLREVLLGPEPVRNALREYFTARLKRVPLGRVSNFIKKTAYQMGSAAYRSPAILKLCELYTFLIDADKNGYNFSDGDYMSYISKDHDIIYKNPPLPKYETAMRNGVETNASEEVLSSHPNDIVFFTVIRPQITNILKQFAKSGERSKSFSDPTLLKLYFEYLRDPNPVIHAEMQRLKDAIISIRERWKKSWKVYSSGEKTEIIISQFKAEYKRVRPRDPHLADSWTAYRYAQEPSLWALIKASALYAILHQEQRTSIIYQLAGSDLAYIKVHDVDHRIIVDPVWSILKPRKRKGKLMFSSEIGSRRTIAGEGAKHYDKAEDEYYLAVEEMDIDG